VPAAGEDHHKRVLLLFDEDQTLPGLAVLDRTIRSTLSAGLEGDVEFFTESIHSARFPEEQHERALGDYLAKTYGGLKLDLIVGVMGPAVMFLLEHANRFAQDVPIVFCGADARDIEGVTLPSRMTGVLVRRVFGPTLDVALRLQPETQHVFVAGGTSGFDRQLLGAARHEFQSFERRVSFTYLTDLSMGDLLAAVSRVPPHSIILYSTLFRDGAGQSFVPHDVASRISAAARAPVYIFVDQYLGLGPVGGYLYSLELHGRASAELGLRVLRGESPANIPVREVPDNQYMFDARQIDRWKLDGRLLPANSLIKFRESSIWDRYRTYIIGVVTLVAFQMVLIVGLLVQHSRRRKAEAELRTSFERIHEIQGRLLSAQETERTHIARELHDDISQQLALLKLDLHQLTGMVQGSAEAVAGEAAEYADGIATSIRELSHRLYPAKLRLVGLVAALEALLNELSHHSFRIAFTHEGVPAIIPEDLTLCLYRVVQEGVQNALKHSRAGNVSIHLSGNPFGLALTVVDDGVGFIVDEAWRPGFGLLNMGERVEALGGTFNVRSIPHRGTILAISVPVGAAHHTSAVAS
jgi:signal transduction histidine kinase